MSHSRPPADLPSVTVFVDPQCPFAWITYQWLRQAERGQAVEVTVELMSLACVNEHQDLDPDYRAYNDDSWAAARVSAALLASAEAHRWPDFYDAYGRRRHVEGLRDNPANIAASLREFGLPADLGNAARDPSWDADLRARTQEAVAGVDPPGGTPITRIGTRAYFGPVLTAIPDVEDSVRAWTALATLATIPGMASFSTQRDEHLTTAR